MSVALKDHGLAIRQKDELKGANYKIGAFPSAMALAAMLLSGTFYITDSYRFLQAPLLVLSVTYFVGVFIVRHGRFRRTLSTTILAFYITCVLMLLSSTISTDVDLLVRALGFLIVGFVTLSVYPTLRVAAALQRIYRVFLATHLPLVLISILVEGVTLYRYQGIFYNPNSFGNVMATLFALSWAYFCGLLLITRAKGRRFPVIHPLLTALLVVGTFVGVLISQSRTSVLGSLLSSIVVLLAYMPAPKSGRIRRRQLVQLRVLLGLAFSAAAFMLIGMTTDTWLAMAARLVIEKFEAKSSAGDILGGRLAIWEDTIRQARLLGGKRDVFSDGPGAHSTFISLLGQYGWIPLLSFLVFITLSFSSAMRYLRTRRSWDPYAGVPLASVSIFVTLSVGEGMFQKVSMYLFLLSIGIAVDELLATRRRKRGVIAGTKMDKTAGNIFRKIAGMKNPHL